MIRESKWMTAWLLLLVPLAGLSTDGSPVRLSLQSACRYALEHSVNVQNAELDIRKARKKIWETTAIGLPRVEGSISYQNMLDIPTTLIPAKIFDPGAPEGEFLEMKFGTQHNATYEVTASQLLFQGSWFVALQASRVFFQLSQDALKKTWVDVRERVSRSYYLVLLSRRIRDNLQENRETLDQILRETRAMNRAGFLEDTAVDQIRILKMKIRYQLEAVKRQNRNTERLLKYQMGMPLEQKIQLTQSLDDFLEKLDYREWMERKTDVRDNIDYKVLNTRVKSQELMVRKEKSEYLPSVSAFFSYSRNAMRDRFNFLNSDESWFPSTILGINISVPVFQSGMKAARVRQAEMELEKIKNQRADVRKGLKLRMADARSSFAAAYGELKSSGENLKLARRIYRKNQVKFSKGMTSSLELSQTHNQYLEAQTTRVNAVYSFLTAHLALKKSLNELQEIEK